MHKSTLPPRRRYPPELKLKIVHEAITGSESKAAIAREYDINANMLSNWIREFRNEARWVKKANSPMIPMIVVDHSTDQHAPNHQPCAQTPESTRPSMSVMSIRFNSGHQLNLSNPTDTQLGQILRALV